jgi:hypothetical protein
MVSNRMALAAVGVACVAAAAAGGYLAGRQGPAPAATVAMADQAADASPGAAQVAPPPDAVAETEAVVGDAPAKPVTPAQTEAAATSRPRASAPRAPAESAPRATARTNREPTQPAPPARVEAPSLDRTWPSSAASAPPAPVAEPIAVPLAAAEERIPDVPRAPEPPQPAYDELVVSADSVIGLQTETSLSSERARVEDRVEARVVRDVRVGGRVAIPAGTRALGSVTVVERGGKMRERARLGIRFHTLALADGTRVPVTTETIYRYGEDRGNRSAAKIGGGAVAGAILGAIIGGGKGAAIGATTGAAGGTAAVMGGDRSEATFQAGSEMTARILSPVTVTVER